MTNTIKKEDLSQENIVQYLLDIFKRRGAEAYLGESISMSEHMLQAAYAAELDEQSDEVISAALLHDIGHFTGEFPDDYIEQGVDNHHEKTGSAILERFFPESICYPVRWHVDAKRYLCAKEPDYFSGLSDASVKTLELQGGIFDEEQVKQFESSPDYLSAVQVRRYDDAAKVIGLETPPVEHYLQIVQRVLDK